ncbi:MAG: alkaline phosphatase family protein, partial [Bryobacteraceae bacterium]
MPTTSSLPLKILIAGIALSAALWNWGCSNESKAAGRKVIVLGVDGMDPHFVEEHWAALPNLERLRKSGDFKRLATTTPPQSPVAWSTVATGLDPAEHGIYDFVHRNPSTMAPFSSMAETEEPRFNLPLGPWRFPLDNGSVRSLRRGRTFWEILGAAGIPVTLLRMPANYPAAPFRGTALSGMGTPDLAGTFGTFTLFTDSPYEETRQVAGGRIEKVDLSAYHAVLSIRGPLNSLRKDRAESSVPMAVDVDPSAAVARFTVADEQFILREGEWSKWISLRYTLIPGLAHANGMVRVYASQLHPGFR